MKLNSYSEEDDREGRNENGDGHRGANRDRQLRQKEVWKTAMQTVIERCGKNGD